MRIFKTSWFNKAAKKAHMKDSELRIAIDQVIKGQAVDLGGGVSYIPAIFCEFFD